MDTNELGVGLVYWPDLEPLFRDRDLGITSLEVEVEAYWLETGELDNRYRVDSHALRRIAALPQSKVVHGVGFPLGTCRVPDPAHLAPLRESLALLDARWYSEHLAFNRTWGPQGACATGFLLPPLQTEQGVRAVAHTIRRIKSALDLPLAVETGVNYLERRPWEMEDGTFVARVVELADCDILLDLHNLWTNARNGRQSVSAFLAEIPPERIREIHLAGGIEYQGYWVDAHSGLVPDEVLELARDLVPRLPNLKAIHVEILPQFIPFVDLLELKGQIREIHAIWEQRATHAGVWYHPAASRPESEPAPGGCTPLAWEDTLGALVARTPVSLDSDWSRVLAGDPGVSLYSDLARTFRAGVVVDQLKMSSRLLMQVVGRDGFRSLLNGYWRDHPPQAFASTECRGFASWLLLDPPEIAHLRSLIEYDLALIAMGEDDRARAVHFDCEPLALLTALGRGRSPDRIEPGDYELELTADAPLTRGRREVGVMPRPDRAASAAMGLNLSPA
jgi:uncharacterized protein (UPF0276 family)